jgi:hypothetical protein
MRFTACFYKLNDDFSPEYADAQNNGDPSENNRLYEWEDELVLKNQIKSVNIEESATFVLQGERNGIKFMEHIDDMAIFNIVGEDGSITQMACSQELLEKHELLKDEGFMLSVFLKGSEPLSNPIPGIYIALQRFPKNLIDV